MALSTTHRFLWLDAFIGKDGECNEFKRRFCTSIEANARYGDAIDICIYALHENAAPFIFVDTHEQAIEQIEIHCDKKIIFISSGSLGKIIIPEISQKYPRVYSFYIFCALIENYVELAVEYRDTLQVFNCEIDLLVRLMRDLSFELINQGNGSLVQHSPRVALEYFQRSHILEETANTQDKLNDPFLGNLRLLDGYRDDIGLFRTAQQMINEEEADQTILEPLPLRPESSGEELDSTPQDGDLSATEQESQEAQ